MKNHKFLNLTHTFCESAIKYIALILLALLTILTAVFQSTVSFHWTEVCTITTNGIKFFFLLILGLCLLILIQKLLDRIPETAMIIAFSVLYLAAGFFCISHMEFEIGDDPLSCYNTAFCFFNGNYSEITPGSYLYRVPHQLGLMVYDQLIMHINTSKKFICQLNIIWIVISNLLVWLTSRMIYEQSARTRKNIVLFSFAFLPGFFFLFFAYGTVPGFVCLLAAMYFTVRAIRKHCPWCMILSWIFVAMACILKKNFLIGGIGILGIVFSLLVPGKLLLNHYETLTGSPLTNGMPSSLYIAMGLQENNNDWCAYGWYNHFNDNTYNSVNFDPQVASEIAVASIQDRLHTFITDPGYAFAFFREKVITTWCEPMFQSIWSGPRIDSGSTTDISLLENIYSGGSLFNLMASAMNVLVTGIFLFSTIYIFRKTFITKETLNALELFCVLYFIGGFLFHFIWETKSQYVYPYVLVLIPLASEGIKSVHQLLDQYLSRIKHRP